MEKVISLMIKNKNLRIWFFMCFFYLIKSINLIAKALLVLNSKLMEKIKSIDIVMINILVQFFGLQWLINGASFFIFMLFLQDFLKFFHPNDALIYIYNSRFHFVLLGGNKQVYHISLWNIIFFKEVFLFTLRLDQIPISITKSLSKF